MNRYDVVSSSLKEWIGNEHRPLQNDCLEEIEFPLLALRDILFCLGQIRFEDLERQIYIADIKGGFLKMNTATVAVQVTTNAILFAASAAEGIIYQHTSEDAINEVKKAIIRYQKQNTSEK